MHYKCRAAKYTQKSSVSQLSEVWSPPLNDFRGLVQKFSDAATSYPNNIALVCTHQQPSLYEISSIPIISYKDNLPDQDPAPYLRWTFRSLRSGVDRLKCGLISLGIGKGSTIVTFLPNCAEHVMTWWAALELEATIAPLDLRNLSNKEDAKYMLKVIMSVAAGPVAIIAWEQGDLKFDLSLACPEASKIMVCPEGIESGWTLFENLIQIEKAERCPSESDHSADNIILFTSGSTSRPKGVKWRCPMHFAATSQSVVGPPEYSTLPGDLWCGSGPNNHGVGCGTISIPMCEGAGVIYSGPFFSVEETIASLYGERCTHACWVPSMVSLIADAMDKGPAKHLKNISLGGSLLNKKTFHQALEVIGARSVSAVYGMTEGVVGLGLCATDPSQIIDEHERVSVGYASAGNAFKIRDPESSNTDALPKGSVGEICFTGNIPEPSMYIGIDDTPEIIHVDSEGCRWFRTGDQGLMSDDGQLRILGRYKDIIKRGGEGISPAAIETKLAGEPDLSRVEILIVGAPDHLAGEVPIAVVKGRSGPVQDVEETTRKITKSIREFMGPLWVPQEVILLEVLGLEDWPRASGGKVGKISKVTLANIVRDYLAEKTTSFADKGISMMKETPFVHDLRQELLSIWSGALGLPVSSLPMEDTISTITDSLTTATVRGEIRRMAPAAAKISVKSIQEGTIAGLLDLVLRQTAGNENQADFENTPTVANMVHITTRPDLYRPTVDMVQGVVEKHGFHWKDVESVFPAQNFVGELALQGVLDSGKFQLSYLTQERSIELTDPWPLQRVRDALKAVLSNNRILASFLVEDTSGETTLGPNLALHVTLRHNTGLFEHVLVDGGCVDTVEELRDLATNHPHPEWALNPGIMFRSLLYNIKQTGTAGFVTSVSHSVMDASFQARFHADLDKTLSGTALHPHVEYKLWAEMYYSSRQSPQAKASIDWHATYLDGIYQHFKAGKSRWPPTVERGPFDPKGVNYPTGVWHSFQVPEMSTLRREHTHISAAVIIKTALALLNVERTGTNHAVFSSVQSGRTAWPFLPVSMTDERANVAGGLFSDGTDVAGPLLQAVTNLINIDREETVLELLSRQQREQHDLTKHAHAVWPDIEAELDARSSIAAHGGLCRKVFTTQCLNWVPGFGAPGSSLTKQPYENFKIVNVVTRWRVGVIIRVGVGGMDNATVTFNLIGDMLDEGQKKTMADDMEKIVRWLTRLENWNTPIYSRRP